MVKGQKFHYWSKISGTREPTSSSWQMFWTSLFCLWAKTEVLTTSCNWEYSILSANVTYNFKTLPNPLDNFCFPHNPPNRFPSIQNNVSPPLQNSGTCKLPLRQQRSNHRTLVNQRSILHTQREIFKRNVLKSGTWPASKHEIISKHLKSFLPFIKSINFDLLQRLQIIYTREFDISVTVHHIYK